MIDESYKWYVVYTRNQHEKKVFKDSIKMNIVAFLPMEKRVRYWSDRKKIIDSPLFPNYVFLKLSNREYFSILGHPSVVQFVKQGNELSTISDEQIQSVQTIIDKQMEYNIKRYCPEKGSVVQIMSGPLKGFFGEVVRTNNETHAIIRIREIWQSIYVKIDRDALVIV